MRLCVNPRLDSLGRREGVNVLSFSPPPAGKGSRYTQPRIRSKQRVTRGFGTSGEGIFESKKRQSQRAQRYGDSFR